MEGFSQLKDKHKNVCAKKILKRNTEWVESLAIQTKNTKKGKI